MKTVLVTFKQAGRLQWRLAIQKEYRTKKADYVVDYFRDNCGRTWTRVEKFLPQSYHLFGPGQWKYRVGYRETWRAKDGRLYDWDEVGQG